jgi:dihydrofolate reductase
MADTMNSTPKHVVSSTLENRRWNSTVIDGHRRSSTVIDGSGGPVLVSGSCRLMHTLLLSGLIDTLRMQIFPVSIGRGLRLFPDSGQARLQPRQPADVRQRRPRLRVHNRDLNLNDWRDGDSQLGISERSA